LISVDLFFLERFSTARYVQLLAAECSHLAVAGSIYRDYLTYCVPLVSLCTLDKCL